MAEVVKLFGDPAHYRTNDGTLSSQWETDHITRVILPRPLRYVDGGFVSRIAVHRLLASNALATLSEIAGHIELYDVLQPYGGGFEPRLKRGSSAISLHTFGIALDFAPDRFPLGSLQRWPAALVAIWEKHGWFYGGNFHGRKDPMHVQFATGC